MPQLTETQVNIIRSPLAGKIFLQGPAGSGKTTVGVERLRYLLRSGVPADDFLILVPQRTLAIPYYDVIFDPGLVAGGTVDVFTIGGLAQKMIELFWPLVAEDAGFKNPDLPPTFLNIETAQYHMASLVRPLLDHERMFDGVALDRNRLYSQILDNLNKAAFNGFPHTDIEKRLIASNINPEIQNRIYQDAQDCAIRFRDYCLENNLLDFSLVLEIFVKHIWNNPLCYAYLVNRYRHLIVDNVEEDTPVTHDILRDWLHDFESALVIYDTEAGFRRFLSANPRTALELQELIPEVVAFTESFVTSEAVEGIRGSVELIMSPGARPPRLYAGEGLHFSSAPCRFYPEMLTWVSERIAELVQVHDVSPGEIVVLAPYLSDALRFSLMINLEASGIPVQSHRPSRALREEPAAQCLLTLAALCNPAWGIRPVSFDVAYALRQSISGLDLIRSQLLTEVLYRPIEGVPTLLPFDQVKPDMQARISYVLGERYDYLRTWLDAYSQDAPDAPDIFFSRLFGEVLSQPGFGFHEDFDAGKAAANLIDSAREFRWVVGPQLAATGQTVGGAFLLMVQEGVLASQYIGSWEQQRADAVLLAPAYTFLMNNRPVDYQFWVNVSSKGWSERLYQPVTHPYVLSRDWEIGKKWTDAEEFQYSRANMFGLVNGLLRRCRLGVFLGLSEMDEHGYEQRGPLLNVLQGVLRIGREGR